jgi:hypothetical protein
MKRLYLILRLDLSESYRCCQGCHALAAFGLQHPSLFAVWNNETISMLGVRNAKLLRDVRTMLDYRQINSAENDRLFSGLAPV